MNSSLYAWKYCTNENETPKEKYQMVSVINKHSK